MSDSPRLRAAIVGAGLMGRWHADAVVRAGHRVSVVVDEREDVARRLAARHGARVLPLDVALERCDVVHVCVPVAHHEAIVRDAIAAHKSVVCEKPLALSAGVTESLFAAAAAAHVLLIPVHQFLYQRGMQRLSAALPSLGEPVHVEVIACTAGGDGRGTAARDLVAFDILPHPLSLIERWWPGSLAGHQWHVTVPDAGELRVHGTRAHMSTSITVSCAARPTRNSVRVFASHGTATVDLYHGFGFIERGRASRMQKLRQPFASAFTSLAMATSNLLYRAARNESAYPGLRPLIALTYAAIRDGTTGPISATESIAVARAGDAVRALANRSSP